MRMFWHYIRLTYPPPQQISDHKEERSEAVDIKDIAGMREIPKS